MKPLLLFLAFPLITFNSSLITPHSPRLSDSLAMYERKLTNYSRQVDELYDKIETPTDRKVYDVDIDILRSDLENLRKSSDLIADEPELNKIYGYCRKRLAQIDEKVEKYRMERTCDSLLKEESNCQRTLDSMLSRGHQLVQRQRGDSVKMLKQDLEDNWCEIQQMRTTYNSAWDHDKRLADGYSRLQKTRDEIKALSEKEKLKIGDILMKVLVVLGVITILIGVVGSNIRSKKLKKKAAEIPAIEL